MTAAETTAMVPAPERSPTASPVPYLASFDGAGVAPFEDAIRTALATPVDPGIVEIKPDGIPYVPGVEWRRALTRAFGAGGWAIVPRSPARIVGNVVTYHGALVCHGRFVAESVGEAQYRANNPNSSYATALEGAKTDAVGRCCKDLTLYSELWNPPWLERFKATHCESYKGEKYVWDEDARKKVKKECTLWRRKDHRTRRPPDALDLISGAGGRLPDTTPPPAAPLSEPPSNVVSLPTEPADDGVAPSDEERVALEKEVRRLGWKPVTAKAWLNKRFGVESIGELTFMQTATAQALLMALQPGQKFADCPVYLEMLKSFLAKGRVKA